MVDKVTGKTMQVAVIAKDSLVADGIVSVLANEGQLPTSGAARNVAQASKMVANMGVLVVVADGLEVEDWIQLGKVQADGGMKVLLVVTSSNDDISGKSAADVIVHSRDGGASVINAVKQMLPDAAISGVAAMMGSGAVMVRENGDKLNYGRRGRGLTRREKDVASYVALGMSNRRISEVLQLQEQSVKNLVSSIMRKLDCENRVQIALKLTGKPTSEA